MEIHELLRVLRRRWWVVLLTTALGVSIAAVATFTAQPSFVTSTRVYITVRSTGSEFGLWVGGAYTRRGAGTYEDLATSSIVLRPVIQELHLPYSIDQLASRITSTASQAEQGVIDIQVTDTSGERAAAIANDVAEELGTLAEQLSTSATSNGPIVTITQTQPARAPHVAMFPRVNVDLVVGLLAGLLAGLVIGTRIERSDTRLRRVEDVARVTDLPVLAMTASEGRRTDGVDDVRALAESLRYLDDGGASRTFLLAAVSGRDAHSLGRSLATAITTTLASDADRVLLVDADLRRPGPLPDRTGVADILAGRGEVDEAVITTDREQLDLLPSGTVPPNPAELLHSARSVPLLDRLRDRYAVVVIETAPLVPLADASGLAPLVDGTIVVCTLGLTRVEQLADALDRVTASGGRALGLVLTGVSPSDRPSGGRDRPRRTRQPIGAGR